jgi:hypothetical protein
LGIGSGDGLFFLLRHEFICGVGIEISEWVSGAVDRGSGGDFRHRRSLDGLDFDCRAGGFFLFLWSEVGTRRQDEGKRAEEEEFHGESRVSHESDSQRHGKQCRKT